VAGIVVFNLVSIAIYSDDRRTAMFSAGGRHVSEHIAAAYLTIGQTAAQQRPVIVQSLWEPMFLIIWTEQSILSNNLKEGWRSHIVRSAIKDYLSGMDKSKNHIAYQHLSENQGDMVDGDPAISMQQHMGRMMGDQSSSMHERFSCFSRKWHGDSVLNVSMQLTDGSWFNVATPGILLRPQWWSRVLGPIFG
jgi:hypothetical protein